MRVVGAQSPAPAPQLATRPQRGQPEHFFFFPCCCFLGVLYRSSLPQPLPADQELQLVLQVVPVARRDGQAQGDPGGTSTSRGKTAIPLTSGTAQLPRAGISQAARPHGSRSSTFLQLRSLRRDISHNNLLETPAGTTLPGSETSKHPQLPTLSPSRLRKAGAPWKWGKQPSPSPWGQPPWPAPTSRVQQQVPGVEVPAQHALLVKPL